MRGNWQLWHACAGCRRPNRRRRCWLCRPQPPGAATVARVEIMNAGTRGFASDDKSYAPQSFLRVFVNTASGMGEGCPAWRAVHFAH